MTEQQETPVFTDDELLHQRGQEAEQFLHSLEEGTKYYLNLMADCQKELVDRLIALSPLQIGEFTVLKAQLEALYIPLHRVYADIEIGKKAWERINNVIDPTQGIL